MKRILFLVLVIIVLNGCSEQSTDRPTLVLKGNERQIVFEHSYADCEHVVSAGMERRSSLETEGELKTAFPDFELSVFNETTAVLTKHKKGKCKDHFLFREYKGRIGVFRENNGALLDVLDVPVAQLREQDQKMLKDGISLFGKEECAAFWDDFCS